MKDRVVVHNALDLRQKSLQGQPSSLRSRDMRVTGEVQQNIAAKHTKQGAVPAPRGTRYSERDAS